MAFRNLTVVPILYIQGKNDKENNMEDTLGTIAGVTIVILIIAGLYFLNAYGMLPALGCETGNAIAGCL